jgi:hypothetical protein
MPKTVFSEKDIFFVENCKKSPKNGKICRKLAKNLGKLANIAENIEHSITDPRLERGGGRPCVHPVQHQVQRPAEVQRPHPDASQGEAQHPERTGVSSRSFLFHLSYFIDYFLLFFRS